MQDVGGKARLIKGSKWELIREIIRWVKITGYYN